MADSFHLVDVRTLLSRVRAARLSLADTLAAGLREALADRPGETAGGPEGAGPVLWEQHRLARLQALRPFFETGWAEIRRGHIDPVRALLTRTIFEATQIANALQRSSSILSRKAHERVRVGASGLRDDAERLARLLDSSDGRSREESADSAAPRASGRPQTGAQIHPVHTGLWLERIPTPSRRRPLVVIASASRARARFVTANGQPLSSPFPDDPIVDRVLLLRPDDARRLSAALQAVEQGEEQAWRDGDTGEFPGYDTN